MTWIALLMMVIHMVVSILRELTFGVGAPVVIPDRPHQHQPSLKAAL